MNDDTVPGPTPGLQTLTTDMPVLALDGKVGVLADVIIDPVAMRATHLVVRRGHARGEHHSWLVPIDQAHNEGDHLRLSLTVAEVTGGDPIDHTELIPVGGWPHRTALGDVGVVRVLAWPWFPASDHAPGVPGVPELDTVVAYDRVPEGSAEIRRRSEVYTCEHEMVGHVDGFVVDAAGTVADVVLMRGHSFGAREVTIPLTAVRSITTDAVYLHATRAEVDGWTPRRFRRPRHDA